MPFGISAWTLIILSMPIFIYYFLAKEDVEDTIKYSIMAVAFFLVLTNSGIIPNILDIYNDNRTISTLEDNATIELPQGVPNPYMNITVETPKNKTVPWDNDWLKEK
jgi:hypothetical protein